MCIELSDDLPEVPHAAVLSNVRADYYPDRIMAVVASASTKLTARRFSAHSQSAGKLPSIPQLLKRVNVLIPRATALLALGNDEAHAVQPATLHVEAESGPIWEEASEIAAVLDQMKYAIYDELDEIIAHLLNLAQLGGPYFESEFTVGIQPTWIESQNEPAQGDLDAAYDHPSAAPWWSTQSQATHRTADGILNALSLAITPGVLRFRPAESFDTCSVSRADLTGAPL